MLLPQALKRPGRAHPTSPGVGISSFTQAQLNANQVVYVHDDSNTTSDSFTFDVQDGSGNNLTGQTFSITINSVDDDAPVITANTGIALDEGATETINSGELQANDPDTDNNTLTYNITSAPTNGKVELTTGPGVAISNFTQAQLNANQVVYVHDDSNTTSDSFTFDIQDGSGNNLTGQTLIITINPIDDDAPTISTLSIGSDNAAPEFATGGDVVTVTFMANESLDISSLSLTNIKSGGIAVGNNAVTYASTANPFEYTAKFTITATDSDGAVSFTLNFSDGAGNAAAAVSNADITNASSVTVDNTIPTIASILAADPNPNNTTSVNYTVTFSENVINVDVADFSLTTGAAITGASVSNVSANSGTEYTVTVSGFTLGASYASGGLRLNFISNGTIQDKVGLTTTTNYIGGTIYTIVHPVPTVTTNTGISLNEGATEIIDSGELQATDSDTDDNTLVYAVTTPSANGQLELATDAGVAITSFTQAQLNANEVVYVHNDSNTTSDNFIFDVQDGSGNNLTSQIFSITINPVDDDLPTITTNTGITLDEGGTETINTTELQSDDTDTNNDNLIYALTSGPSKGQIELTTGPGVGISSFTQAQLNANQVLYVHDDSNTTSDGFTFDLQDGSGNNLAGQTFIITINALDDDMPTISTNTGITLNEGGTETINNTELQSNDTDSNNDNLIYAITSGPSNGQVELTTGPGIGINSFTQAQLNANQVVYVHDDSNTTSDSFTFDVQDGSANNLTGQTFSITINPVDDDAPVITANTGIALDEGATETINSGELQANDPDTDNNTLTYNITSAPANGKVELTTGQV